MYGLHADRISRAEVRILNFRALFFADLCMDNDGELGVGIKKSETPRERHVEDELRPRRDRGRGCH